MEDRLALALCSMAAAGFFLFAALCFFVAVSTLSIGPAIAGLASSATFAVFFRLAQEERRSVSRR